MSRLGAHLRPVVINVKTAQPAPSISSWHRPPFRAAARLEAGVSPGSQNTGRDVCKARGVSVGLWPLRREERTPEVWRLIVSEEQ